MDPELIAPMVVALALIFTTGGVLVLRPLAKRLGTYLEQATQEKARAGTGQPSAEVEQVARVLESLDSRLGALEERVNFTEAMLQSRPREDAARTLPPQG